MCKISQADDDLKDTGLLEKWKDCEGEWWERVDLSNSSMPEAMFLVAREFITGTNASRCHVVARVYQHLMKLWGSHTELALQRHAELGIPVSATPPYGSRTRFHYNGSRTRDDPVVAQAQAAAVADMSGRAAKHPSHIANLVYHYGMYYHLRSLFQTSTF